MKLRFIFVLTLAVISFSSAFAVTPADYAGAWSFNREQSKDMPAQMASIKAFDLVVAADKGLKVDVDIETGTTQVPHVHQTYLYPLDGSESAITTEVMTPNGPMQVPTRLTGKVEENGALDLAISRDLKMREAVRTMKSAEKWELSADGKTMTVHVDEERPSGPAKYTMVFDRKAKG